MKTLSGFISETSPTITKTLKIMQEKASSIDVDVGVAMITVSHVGITDYKLTLSLINNTEVRVNVPQKTDVNFTGVVSAKISQMQRTLKSSGNDDGFIGEVPYKGGMFFRKSGYDVFVAYSGGTEDEDVEITKHGIEVMNDFI